MARTYKRDRLGRFAGGGGGGGGSRRPPARQVSRERNRLTRDNSGRITGIGGSGATARGGRLRTGAGNLRATQTDRLKGRIGGTIKTKTLSPEANFRVVKKQKERFGKVGQAAIEMRRRGALKSSGDIEGLARIARNARTAPRKAATASVAKPKSRSSKAPKRLEFEIQYHGTSRQAANAIRKTGFKESRSGVYGAGVYSSSLRSTALKYTPKGQETIIKLRVPKPKMQKSEKIAGGDMVPMSVRARNRALGVTTIKGPMTTNPNEKWMITTADNASKWIDRRPVVAGAGGRSRRSRRR